MEIATHWRLNNQRYRLQGVEFECGHKSVQPREVCGVCEVKSDKGIVYESKTTPLTLPQETMNQLAAD